MKSKLFVLGSMLVISIAILTSKMATALAYPSTGIISDPSISKSGTSKIAGGTNLVYLPSVASGIWSATTPIDNVAITIVSPVMPGTLIASQPDEANQLATAFSLDPFEELSVVSIPYGTTPPIEQLPSAEPGGADIYRAALADYRTQQGGTPTAGPTVYLFGQPIVSSYSILPLKITSNIEQTTLIVEWVVEALDHLWIVRISRDLSDGTDLVSYLSNLQNLVIDGDNLTSQAVETGVDVGEDDTGATSIRTGDALPVPSWWAGDCDLDNYSAATGVASFRLGGTYDGLVACGPRPWMYAYPSILNPGPIVRFFDGAWGEYEWQCVELAMRYLYLKHGITPYKADGKDVVSNLHVYHPDSPLEVIWNGTPNKPPQPGDVISFLATFISGHVAVVTSTNVDVNGNGTIGVIEQNTDPDGLRTMPVTSWRVGGNMTAINWLHSSSVDEQNYALFFDGVNSYVYIPNSVSLNPQDAITVEAWVKPSDMLESDQGIVGKTEGAGFNLFLNHWSTPSDGRFSFSLYTSDAYVSVTGPANNESDVWYHIAATYDGSVLVLYKNGVEESRKEHHGTIVPSSVPLIIGAEPQEGTITYNFHGIIDEVRIWNIARTQSQIEFDMYHPLPSDEPGLVGYWKFNEGGGQTVLDTVNNNDGRLGSSLIPDIHDPYWVESDCFNQSPTPFLGLPLSYTGSLLCTPKTGQTP